MKTSTHPYRGHQLVGAAHPGNSIFIYNFFYKSFELTVPSHEADVRDIEAEEHERLLPIDVVIAEEVDERQQAHGVERAVAEQRPPREREHRPREQRAHADHEQNVEHGRADDGADADVVERHEHPDGGREQLGSAAPGRHERGPRDVVADLQLLDNNVQRRHEELVAHDGQGDEHVNEADDVQEDGAVAALLFGEEIRREEGLRFVGEEVDGR